MCLKIFVFVTERWRKTRSALVFEDFITFRRCRRSGTLGRRRGTWRRETRSSVVFERSAVTGDRVCLALISFRRALSRGASRELAGTRRFRRSRCGREGADYWREDTRPVGVHCFSQTGRPRRRGTAAARNALYGHRRALVPRRAAPSSIIFDDFIGLALQRGIGARRPAEGVCRSVGRTCDGHARSSRVRRDGRGGARAPSPPF